MADPHDSPEFLDKMVSRALAELGLPLSFHGSVRRLVPAARDAIADPWRACCGSGCDPCVETLGRAVDRTRALLREHAAPREAAG